MNKQTIRVIKDGPIKASGFSAIHYGGQKLSVEGDAFLCRCGQSSNAPFCDGTHSRINFSGKNEVAEPQEIRVWEGQSLKTYFNPNICMHAGACAPLNELRKRELAGDADAAEQIEKTVLACPSGALTYERIDDTARSKVESDEIYITEGGEIRVSCDVATEGFDLQDRQPSNRFTLCRCGLSKNKPFCDASHSERTDFK